ncbi:hypothetical protein Tco_0548034, partial [Tanacetum coccineum]
VPQHQMELSTLGTQAQERKLAKVGAQDRARNEEMVGAQVQAHRSEMVGPPHVPMAPYQIPTKIFKAQNQCRQMYR